MAGTTGTKGLTQAHFDAVADLIARAAASGEPVIPAAKIAKWVANAEAARFGTGGAYSLRIVFVPGSGVAVIVTSAIPGDQVPQTFKNLRGPKQLAGQVVYIDADSAAPQVFPYAAGSTEPPSPSAPTPADDDEGTPTVDPKTGRPPGSGVPPSQPPVAPQPPVPLPANAPLWLVTAAQAIQAKLGPKELAAQEGTGKLKTIDYADMAQLWAQLAPTAKARGSVFAAVIIDFAPADGPEIPPDPPIETPAGSKQFWAQRTAGGRALWVRVNAAGAVIVDAAGRAQVRAKLTDTPSTIDAKTLGGPPPFGRPSKVAVRFVDQEGNVSSTWVKTYVPVKLTGQEIYADQLGARSRRSSSQKLPPAPKPKVPPPAPPPVSTTPPVSQPPPPPQQPQQPGGPTPTPPTPPAQQGPPADDDNSFLFAAAAVAVLLLFSQTGKRSRRRR